MMIDSVILYMLMDS